MAASDARGRGDSPLEQYVRKLLRDADRLRRTPQPVTRFDRGAQDDPPRRLPAEGPAPRAADPLPPSAG